MRQEIDPPKENKINPVIKITAKLEKSLGDVFNQALKRSGMEILSTIKHVKEKIKKE